MADTDPVARATALRTKLSQARDTRAHAEAARAQAESRLAEILQQNNAATVDELRETAAIATREADALLEQAEAAFA